MANFIAVYSTFADETKAQAVAQVLVEQGLVACVNIYPAIKSVYKWKDKLEVTGEVSIIAKTRSSLFAKVKDVILELHDYEVPCIISLDISAGDEKFLAWIENQTISIN